MRTDTVDGFVSDNEHVTVVHEYDDGYGVGLWNNEEGLEIIEYDDNEDICESVAIFEISTVENLIDELIEYVLEEAEDETPIVLEHSEGDL